MKMERPPCMAYQGRQNKVVSQLVRMKSTLERSQEMPGLRFLPLLWLKNGKTLFLFFLLFLWIRPALWGGGKEWGGGGEICDQTPLSIVRPVFNT